MDKKQNDWLRMISLLLQYPDDNLLCGLDELSSVADRCCPGNTRAVIRAFLEDLGKLTLLQAQERYTALFDMAPATTLNLTHHLYGDTEKRATALAQLQHHYEQAGWERIAAELPDYLPLMLEFLSICPKPEHTAPVWQALRGVHALVEGLAKQAPAYAALLQPIAAMATEHGAQPGNTDFPPKGKA
jgi:nitrate reductase delta subunit